MYIINFLLIIKHKLFFHNLAIYPLIVILLSLLAFLKAIFINYFDFDFLSLYLHEGFKYKLTVIFQDFGKLVKVFVKENEYGEVIGCSLLIRLADDQEARLFKLFAFF